MVVKTSIYKTGILFFFFGLGLCLQGQSVEELVRKGLEQDSLKHYYQAIAQFSQAIEKAPGLAVAYFDRAGSYMNSRQYNLALVDFNKAISLDTSLTAAYYNRHLANRYTGNFQFALADINEYIKREPKDLEARDARSDLAVEMKEYTLAVEDLHFLLGKYPQNRSLQVRLGDLYVLQKDYKSAKELYTKMLLADPDEFRTYLSRAYVLNYMGSYEESINDLNLFLLRDPKNPEALKLKADNYFFLKKFDDAASMYSSLLQSDSLNAGLLADYGHCLLQQKQYTQAEKILTRSIQAKGENPAYAYLGRGIARFNLNRGDEACDDWNKSFMLGEKSAKDFLEKNCKTQEMPIVPR